LRAHRISGAFAAKDPEGFARAVAMSYGLRVEHEGGAIRICPCHKHCRKRLIA
jgi:transmembrane sensor